MSDRVVLSGPDGLAKPNSFLFSGGEVQVQLPYKPGGDIDVIARIQDSDTLIELLLVTEVVKRYQTRNSQLKLFIPYFPYARQDRVMNSFEAFSLKVIAKLINDLEYDQVFIVDPHSDVTPALINNVQVIDQLEVFTSRFSRLQSFCKEHKPVIIAPDAGAVKKASKIAVQYGLELIVASKLRDTKTGEILRSTLNLHHEKQLLNKSVLIVDDICDGGRTFVELAKTIKPYLPAEILLYVTHGIFSKGLDVFSGLISKVYTTDSFISKNIEKIPADVDLIIAPLGV